MSEVLIVKEQQVVVLQGRQTVVRDEKVVTRVLTVGMQGPRGIQGEPGAAGGSTLQRVAGETMSALLAVYEIENVVRPLDYRDDDNIFQLLGVTTTAAPAGELVNVQRAGVMNDSAWNWTIGRVYLGAGGTLTQTPQEDGYSTLIGSAVSPTRLILNIQDPIEME